MSTIRNLTKAIDQKSPTKIYKYRLEINLTKQKFFVIFATIFFGILIFGFYKSGLFAKAHTLYDKSEASIFISDTGKKPLSAKVVLKKADDNSDQIILTTDKNGVVNFDNLQNGDYKISISDFGYYSMSDDLVLDRGKNNFNYELVKIPEKSAKISGTALDYSTNLPISGATVTLNKKKIKTDDHGNFSFDKLDIGNYTLKVEVKNYIKYSKEISVDDIFINLKPIVLISASQVGS